MRWLSVLPLLVLSLGGCRNDQAAAQFDACYQRCITPPPGDCRTGHEWCVVACRTGRDLKTRVIPHLAGAAEPVPDGPVTLTSSLAIETMGGVASPMIKRCADLPVEVTEVFSTATDNQSQVEMTLVIGDSPRAADNQVLGHFIFAGIPPAPRGGPQIQVRVRVEKNGVVSVVAKDLKTGRSQPVTTGG
jgi:hypothetical protein